MLLFPLRAERVRVRGVRWVVILNSSSEGAFGSSAAYGGGGGCAPIEGEKGSVCVRAGQLFCGHGQAMRGGGGANLHELQAWEGAQVRSVK